MTDINTPAHTDNRGISYSELAWEQGKREVRFNCDPDKLSLCVCSRSMAASERARQTRESQDDYSIERGTERRQKRDGDGSKSGVIQPEVLHDG